MIGALTFAARQTVHALAPRTTGAFLQKPVRGMKKRRWDDILGGDLWSGALRLRRVHGDRERGGKVGRGVVRGRGGGRRKGRGGRNGKRVRYLKVIGNDFNHSRRSTSPPAFPSAPLRPLTISP